MDSLAVGRFSIGGTPSPTVKVDRVLACGRTPIPDQSSMARSIELSTLIGRAIDQAADGSNGAVIGMFGVVACTIVTGPLSELVN